MKIVIAGGSGQIGQVLLRAFKAAGDNVTLLSRRSDSSSSETVLWDGEALGAWVEQLDGADAVINLAGRSVNCRYNVRNRREIMDSRVNSTRATAEAIAMVASPPKVWLQASTATIYAHRYDQANDDVDGLVGEIDPLLPDTWNFSTTVAKTWEATALAAAIPSSTRLVLMRTAMVMSADHGGVFDVLSNLVR